MVAGRFIAVALMALAATGCRSPEPPPPPPPAATASAKGPAVVAPPSGAASSTAAPAPPASTKPTESAAPAPQPKPAPPPQEMAASKALEVLFLTAPPGPAKRCLRDEPDREARIRCLIRLRYDGDARAKKNALALYDLAGSVAGVDPARRIDGGWRGKIDLVPELPTGRHRRHLRWVLDAHRDFARFFSALEKKGAAKPSYRWRDLSMRFFRSVKRTTPSAYARDLRIAYNVSGSLNKSGPAVRETLFHEIFHINDRLHDTWSVKALTHFHDDILSRCTNKRRHLMTRCLTPYTPNHTLVRGGTYYAFQPGNGVWEYAAELAIRYYREHRAVLAKRRLAKRAFKCGPEPNAKTWKLLVDEFFGGIDLVPPCR